MFLNVDQLEKQLAKKECQEIGSMAAFKVLETQFQTFIKSRIYLDDEYVKMTRKALHKRDYDSWVNERQMQTIEGKVVTSNALDVSLVDTKSSEAELVEQNTSTSSGNDVDADDVDIKPVYDEEPMDEVQLTAECNVFATRQQHTKQPEFNNEGEVDQNAEECHDKRPLLAQLTDNQITELSYQYLTSKNICLKKTIA
ncbi:hypothetical protein Tco_1355188 [Tanacetum coccineum]